MRPTIEWRRHAATSPWGKRAMPRGGVLDGYFFVIAGRAGLSTMYGDTWRSRDGGAWELMSDGAGWGKRAYPDVAVVEGDLVLTGGQSLVRFFNDVWRSSDHGRTWRQVCAEAPWEPRAGHRTIVIDDVIYLFAGGRKSWRRIFHRDLWVSADRGETWELRSELPDDMGRAGMQVVSIDGVIYFMGGDHDRPVFLPNWDGRRNDVWASEDHGRSWDFLGMAAWSPRTGHQCVGYGDRIILAGGHIEGRQRFKQELAHDMWSWKPSLGIDRWELLSNDVWRSDADGEAEGRSDFMFEVRGERLWTLGGDREVMAPWPQNNDVWHADLPTEWVSE